MISGGSAVDNPDVEVGATEVGATSIHTSDTESIVSREGHSDNEGGHLKMSGFTPY